MNDDPSMARSATLDGFEVTHVSLINGVKAGNPRDQERFYRIYSPLIRMRASACGLSATETDDLVQDVMADFFKQQDTFVYNKDRRFKNYFYGMIKYHLFAIYRAKAKESKHIAEGMTDEDLENVPWPNNADNEDDEWEDYIRETAKKELRHALAPVTMQVFLLLVEQKDSPKEIAEKLGISLSSFYNHKAQAQEAFKSLLLKLRDGRMG